MGKTNAELYNLIIVISLPNNGGRSCSGTQDAAPKSSRWDCTTNFFAGFTDKKKNDRYSQADVWLTFLQIHGVELKSLKILIICLLVLPAATAKVNRFIKAVKMIKTRTRKNLSTKLLEQLLMLYFYCDVDSINYDEVLSILSSI